MQLCFHHQTHMQTSHSNVPQSERHTSRNIIVILVVRIAKDPERASNKLVRASRHHSAVLQQTVPARDGGAARVVGRREAVDVSERCLAAGGVDFDLEERGAEGEADGDGRVGGVCAAGGVAAGDGEGCVSGGGVVCWVGGGGEVRGASVQDGGGLHAAGDAEVGER
jgi:hypothetical protein